MFVPKIYEPPLDDYLTTDENVLLQGSLVKEPVLRKRGDHVGVGGLCEHLVKQGEDPTLPEAVAAVD